LFEVHNPPFSSSTSCARISDDSLLLVVNSARIMRSLSCVSSFGDASSFTALTSRQDSDRPRTARPATTATSIASQDIICAISESRGVSSTVGLAFVNLSTAETVLCQICDSQTYAKTVTKIAVFEPTEILFMSSARESKLFYIIQENIPDTAYTFLDRRYWSEKAGHEHVDRLAFPQDVETIKITLGGNYFASCCLAAVRLVLINTKCHNFDSRRC